MRKNKMMRTASGLLVATLLTTSVISGTFAKYTTSSEGKDTARVAKWGVTALVSGDLFGADYATNTAGNEIIVNDNNSNASVKGRTGNNEEANVVAPGTKNNTGVTISISGTPEVANKVTFSSSETTGDNTNKDIFLKAGTYGTMVKAEGVTADNFVENEKGYYTKTTSDGDSVSYQKVNSYTQGTEYYVLQDVVTREQDYYPIQWSVKDNAENGTTTNYTNVAAMVTGLKSNLSTESTNNEALKTIDKSYTITWEWKFSDNNDGADTILGNLIANNAKAVVVKETADESDQNKSYVLPTKGSDYSTDVAFNYSIKVEQVD